MSVRMSLPKTKVLMVLLDAPAEPRYGYELMRATGVKSGTLYPILEQLERAGWLEARWEDLNEDRSGRPPRRWYRLTGLGQAAAREGIEQFAAGLDLGWLVGATRGTMA
jgi:PadR family transcriptional regulator, regulatory protein PadR